MARKIEVLVRGRRFSSISDACKEYNVNYCTVMKRRERGASLEEAMFGMPTSKYKIPNKDSDTGILVRGRKFKSVREACRFYGISHMTVVNRVISGMSLEEALLKPVNRKMSRKHK